MKGPGLRIDVDVRRVWCCPSCGQSQRLGLEVVAPRCLCVRDGVPMKLSTEMRPGRLDLRPDVRSILDRIQSGEEFPRMTSPIDAESERVPREGGSGSYGRTNSRGRPPRSDRSGDGMDHRPQRQSRSEDPQGISNAEALLSAAPPQAVSLPPQAVVEPRPQQPVAPGDDDFGAGLGFDEKSTPQ